MKKLFLIISIITLSGCVEYRAAIGSYGQQASDATLHDALWTICKAVPVGAIKRRFDTVDKLIQYNAMCLDQNHIPVE